MNSQAKQWRLGALARRLIVLPVLVVALSLVFAGVASAQAFQASVTFTGTVPFAKAGGCSNGAFYCGTANIAGYGAASWNLYVLGFTAVQTPCGSTYEATAEFTLASDPNSTLVLDEGGSICGLGDEGAAYRGYFAEPPQAFGHPNAIYGNWTVDPTSTGQFSGLTGSGTDVVNFAGAHGGGSYSGVLG